MLKTKNLIIIIILILIIIGLAFYWFEWRPTQFKKECFQKSDRVKKLMIDANKGDDQIEYTVNSIYKDCLRERGF